MKKGIFKILMALVILMLAISCGKKNDTINIVFLPNESKNLLKSLKKLQVKRQILLQRLTTILLWKTLFRGKLKSLILGPKVF